MQEVKWDPVDLKRYKSAQELEALGLDHLKAELQRHGLKAGETCLSGLYGCTSYPILQLRRLTRSTWQSLPRSRPRVLVCI